jgi:hypothetical protein
VKAKIDRRKYKTAKKVSEDEWEEINIKSKKDRPQWNYLIKPNIE